MTEAAPGAEVPAAIDPKVFRYQEIVFSIMMGVIAILSRDNPLIVFPQVLWAFEALLGFNLAYHVLLRRYKNLWYVPLISVAANIVLASVIIAYSGDFASYFWPMYLLPIFTACLYLERRHVVSAYCAVIGFLGYFYLDSLWEMALWESLEFFVKSGVLALSAAVTMQVAFKERLTRFGLERSREEIDRLAMSLRRRETISLEARKMQTLGQMVAGLLHNLNNPLTVILGSTQLLLQDAAPGSALREDLERIDLAARSCSRLTEDLLAHLRRDVMALEEADVGKILRLALVHFDYQIKSRHLELKEAIPPDLPRLRIRSVSLQLSLIDLLSRATDLALERSLFSVRASRDGDGIAIDIAYACADGQDGLANLEACRQVLANSGGTLEAQASQTGVHYRLRLPKEKGL